MRSRRYTLVLLGGLVFAACGKGNKTTPPVEGSGLTQDEARQVVQDIQEGALPLAPLPPGIMLGFVGGTGKTPLQACSITWTGDTTDADQDGVPVNVSTEVDCDTTMADSMYTLHRVIRGRVEATDADDHDPWVGRVAFSGLGGNGPFEMLMEETGPQYAYTFENRIQGYVEATHQGNTFGNRVDLALFMRQDDGTNPETLDLTYRGSVSFTPSDPNWNPGQEGTPDGELSLDATWILAGVGALTVTTPVPLQLSASCGGDPVSGTLQITDGANTLEITWAACNQWTATYNGSPIQPAF